MSDSETAERWAMQTPARTEREALRDVRKLPAVPKFVLGQSVTYYPRGGRLSQECTITDVGVERGEIVYTNSLNRWGYEGQYTEAQK